MFFVREELEVQQQCVVRDMVTSFALGPTIDAHPEAIAADEPVEAQPAPAQAAPVTDSKAGTNPSCLAVVSRFS
jgi:hypothetical protein